MKSKTVFYSFALGISAIALSSCAPKKPEIGGASSLQVTQAAALPAPNAYGRNAAAISEQLLGPQDLLEVGVDGVDFLAPREIRVDSNGEIAFPLAGAFSVAGQTPREVEAVLRERLVTYGQMRSPSVTVNVKETVSQAVTIEGEVERPGMYPVVGQRSLMDMMAMAGGTTADSDLEDVVIFRTVEGQRYAALYNLDAIRHGAYEDPRVYPHDTVMVGDSSSRAMFDDLLRILPLVTSPLVILIDRLTR